VTAEEALEMCHRCEDPDLLAAAEQIKKAAVDVAKETYSSAVEKIHQNIAETKAANDNCQYDHAKELIQLCREVLSADSLLAALRALKHVDPFKQYPTRADEVEELFNDTIAEERVHKAHKAFELKQGLLGIANAEATIYTSHQGLFNLRDLQRIQAQLVDLVALVEHDDSVKDRTEKLQSTVAKYVQTQKEEEKSAVKAAGGLLGQAETAFKYQKFVDSKCFIYASQSYLIDAKARDEDFAQAAALLRSAQKSGVQTLGKYCKEFDVLTHKTLEAFEDGELLMAVDCAETARSKLMQTMNEHLLFVVFDPCTSQHVEWLKWAQNSARGISRFCEITHALAHARLLEMSKMPNFDILTSSECPTYFLPVLPVASSYTPDNLMVPLPPFQHVADEADETLDTHNFTNVSTSDAMMILEGTLKVPVGVLGDLPASTNWSVKTAKPDWSVLVAKAQALLEVQLQGEEIYEDDQDFEMDEPESKGGTEETSSVAPLLKQKSASIKEEDTLANQVAASAKEPDNSDDAYTPVDQSDDAYTPVSSRPSTAEASLVVTGHARITPMEEKSPQSGKSNSPEHDKFQTDSSAEYMTNLNESIVAKDFEAARIIIANGADVNTPLRDGLGSLLLSMIRNKDVSSEGVRFLLDNGADVRAVDSDLRNGLHLAALQNREDVIHEVIASRHSGAEDNVDSFTIDTLRFLLDSRDATGCTPVQLAMNSKCTKAIQTLVSVGTNTWSLGSDGFNCLHCVIQESYDEVVPVILDSMKDVDCKTANGMSSLMLACGKGNKQVTQLLLAQGANVNFRDPAGRTPLHIAAQGGRESLVKLLLQNKAIDCLDLFGQSAAYLCIIGGHKESLKLMVQNSADLNLKVGGHSLLYIAAYLGRGDLIQVMLDSGCDASAGSDSGYAPLLIAVYKGHCNVVKQIAVAHSAHVDLHAQLKYAQLHRVAQCLALLGAHIDCLRVLQTAQPLVTHDKIPAVPEDSSSIAVLDESTHAWNPEKLAAILGRADCIKLVQSVVSKKVPTAPADTAAPAVVEGTHIVSTKQKDAVDPQNEKSLRELPRAGYQRVKGEDETVTRIMEMLFAHDITALDLVKACKSEGIHILKDADAVEAMVGTLEYSAVINELEGPTETLPGEERPPTSGSTEDPDDLRTKMMEMDLQVINDCFPRPSSPSLQELTVHSPTPCGDDETHLQLSEDVESKLRAENTELQNAISKAQDKVLGTRQLTAAKMRALLKRSDAASLLGVESEVYACMTKAEACFGQCVMCIRTRTAGPSRMCKVCALCEQLCKDTWTAAATALFVLNVEWTESNLELNDLVKAAETLQVARIWLNRLIVDKKEITTKERALQARWRLIEDKCILLEVMACGEDLILKVQTADTVRRGKIALDKFCQNMISLTSTVSSMLCSFERHECSSADISNCTEQVRRTRTAFMRAGDLVSRQDYSALAQIARVVRGVAGISHAWDLMANGSSKVENNDGLSMRLARKCVVECETLCIASREEFTLLLQGGSPPSATGDGNVTAEALAFRKSRSISDVGLMKELDGIGTVYIEVATKVLDDLQVQMQTVSQMIAENETSFLQRRMKEALADCATDIEIEITGEKERLVETELILLERQARQQYDASEYASSLETLAEWTAVTDGGGLSRKTIAGAFEVLNFEFRVSHLRSKQMDAERKLEQASNSLDSKPDYAEHMFLQARKEFEQVHEQRPSILHTLLEISYRINYALYETMVAEELVSAAIKSSEYASLEAAEGDLQSALYEAQEALEQDQFDRCVDLCETALVVFRCTLAELSGENTDNSTAHEIAVLLTEAKELVRMETAAHRTAEQLQGARQGYTGVNFDDTRTVLSRARKSSEAAGRRLMKGVADDLQSFAEELDDDEILSVWQNVVSKVEVTRDAEISEEISEFVSDSVASVATVLSQIINEDAGAMLTKNRLETLIDTLAATERRATVQATYLVRPPSSDELWVAALNLSRECRHLVLCADARERADEWLTAVKAFQDRDTKYIPRRAMRLAKSALQVARHSAPVDGYTPLCDIPMDCGICEEVVRGILKMCDDETEKCIADTKGRIMLSKEKLVKATTAVLQGEIAACEDLQAQMVALGVVMPGVFWERSKQVEAVASMSRRRCDLESLALKEHAATLDLIEEQVSHSTLALLLCPHCSFLSHALYTLHAYVCVHFYASVCTYMYIHTEVYIHCNAVNPTEMSHAVWLHQQIPEYSHAFQCACLRVNVSCAQTFDAARDLAAKNLDTKRLLESATVESRLLLAELEHAQGENLDLMFLNPIFPETQSCRAAQILQRQPNFWEGRTAAS